MVKSGVKRRRSSHTTGVQRQISGTEMAGAVKSMVREGIVRERRADVAVQNTERVARLAVHRGLVDNSLRSFVWPLLAGCQPSEPTPQISYPLPSNCCETVVDNDVKRSLWNYEDEAVRAERRGLLSRVLLRTLSSSVVPSPASPSSPPSAALHYFQGLNDIASVFVTVFDDEPEELVAKLFYYVCRMKLTRRFARPGMQPTEDYIARVFFLLAAHDLPLADHLLTVGGTNLVPACHFALSWVITWFAHEIGDQRHVARVFDWILAYPHLDSAADVATGGPMEDYSLLVLSVALLIHRREIVLIAGDGDMDDGFLLLYAYLKKLPAGITSDEDCERWLHIAALVGNCAKRTAVAEAEYQKFTATGGGAASVDILRAVAHGVHRSCSPFPKWDDGVVASKLFPSTSEHQQGFLSMVAAKFRTPLRITAALVLGSTAVGVAVLAPLLEQSLLGA